MRTIIVIILLLGFVGANEALAQARVYNSSGSKIVVGSLTGPDEVIIPAKSQALVRFLPEDGVANFKLSRYEGFNKVGIGTATRLAKNGKIALRDLSLDDGSAVESQAQTGRSSSKSTEKSGEKTGYEASSSKKVFGSGSSSGGSRISSDDIKKSYESERTSELAKNYESSSSQRNYSNEQALETSLVLSNSSYRLVVLEGPFKGFALASEQTSQNSRRVGLGKLNFSVYFDAQVDSMSTGRQHRWSAISKIIVEGQDTLHIYDTDLTIGSGEPIKKKVKNPFKDNSFLIVGGPNNGVVIPARNMALLDLNLGWNYIPIQYISKEGAPIQATLLLMADGSKKPIVISRRSNASIDSIDPNELVFTGAN